MSTPDEIAGPLAEVAKDLAPQVYEDGLQPTVKEVGHALHAVVRTALLPVHGVAWTAEQAFRWVGDRVAGLFERKGVKAERIVSPSPQITYGVIRGIQATGAESEPDLREMYAALLATAMDAQTALSAHPAFAEILHQMLPDEAKIIRVLGRHGGKALIKIAINATRVCHPSPSEPGTAERFSEVHSSLAGEAGCENQEMIASYIGNLRRLGLVSDGPVTFGIPPDLPPETYSSLASPLTDWLFGYDYEVVSDLMARVRQFRSKCNPTGFSADVELLQLTPFGSQFVAACIAE